MGTSRAGSTAERVRALARQFIRSVPVWLSLIVLLLSVVALLVEPTFIVSLRDSVFDFYQRLQPREYQPAAVRVVDIDDESLSRLGKQPWPRTLISDLIVRLRDQGATAIALDMLFAEPDRTSVAAVLQTWIEDDKVRSLVERLPDHDQLLAEAITGGSVITGFVLNQRAETATFPATKAQFVIAGDDPQPFLPNFLGSVNSLPLFEDPAAGNGALNVAASQDGVVRRVQLLIRTGEMIYPTLTAEALRVARRGSNYVIKSSGASGESRGGGMSGVTSIRIGDLRVKTDPYAGIWLHYSRPIPARSIPAWKVLEGTVADSEFAAAIVFIGTSAAGLEDLRLDPLGNVISHAEIHAQAAEQILQATYLRRPDWAEAAEGLFMVVMWILLVAPVSRVGAASLAAVGLALVAASFAISWWAFDSYRLLLDPFHSSIMTIVVFLVCSVTRQVTTEREKRWIRDTFASYISPNLVEYLIENPGEFGAGGERRECSFVMTDLAGFTSLVEGSEPAEVVALLNEYLEGMISVALNHEGTLDRIVGDAVAVMFSAPVHQPDHAERAVACALEMDDFAEAFRERKQAEGFAVGIARIGVHTGTVTIGNVGGASFLDYRALGDPVNTAARLETVNKHLGTRVCVSGVTVSACPGFIGRPVGSLVLKGKTEAIEAYEPLTEESAASEQIAAYLRAFEALTSDDPNVEDAFESLLEDYPDDSLAAFHLARLRRGERGPTIVVSAK